MFSRWSGTINSPYNPVVIYMNSSYSINATFISQSDFIAGDANGDGRIIASDIVYLIQYFRGIGQPPVIFLAGDSNGNCSVTGQDVTFMVNYFRSIGPAPFRGNCNGEILSINDLPQERPIQ